MVTNLREQYNKKLQYALTETEEILKSGYISEIFSIVAKEKEYELSVQSLKCIFLKNHPEGPELYAKNEKARLGRLKKSNNNNKDFLKKTATDFSCNGEDDYSQKYKGICFEINGEDHVFLGICKNGWIQSIKKGAMNPLNTKVKLDWHAAEHEIINIKKQIERNAEKN